MTALPYLLAPALVAFWMWAVARFEAWSERREALAAARRDAAAAFEAHPGADETWADDLRVWLDAGQGSAVAR